MFLDRVILSVIAGSVHRVIGLCHDQSLHRSLFRLPQGVKGGRYKNRIKKWTPMLITVDVKGMDYVPPPPRQRNNNLYEMLSGWSLAIDQIIHSSKKICPIFMVLYLWIQLRCRSKK